MFLSDLSDIRRTNLARLRKQLEYNFKQIKGSSSRYTNILFSKDIGLTPSTYNQLINKKYKPVFSEYYARGIEKACELDNNWLDIDFSLGDVSKMSIGLEKFIVGHKKLNEFIDLQILSKDNVELNDKLLKSLFIYLAQAESEKNISLDKSVFLNFLNDIS